MPAKIDILSFEAGLIDALVEPRTTAVNHGRGCRQCENFITLAQGPAVSRPPSRYMAATKASGQARFFEVTVSELYSYLAEFGNGYVRFFTHAGQIESGGAAYEIASSPYDTADLSDLQVHNDAGTLYLTHLSDPPYRLVYASDTAWTLEAVPFTWGPFRDYNDLTGGTATIKPSLTTGNITLTASAPTFVKANPSHVGALWKIGHRVQTTSLKSAFFVPSGEEQAGTSIAVGQDCRAAMHVIGVLWSGTVYLERSYDAGATWEIVDIADGAQMTDYTAELIEASPGAIYRFRISQYTEVGGLYPAVQCTLTVYPPTDRYVYGYVRITAVTDSTHANATVVSTLAGTAATIRWAEGAWSPYRGYPRGVGVYDNRLCLVGNTEQPTTIWMSYTNNYTQMATGSTAAHALTFKFNSIPKGNPFLWFIGEEYQFWIGTPAMLYQFRAADPTSSISAVNKPAVTRKIKIGCAAQSPVEALGMMVFLDAGRTSLRRVEYSMERDLLFATPLNFQCPTVTEAGVKRIVFQDGKVPILWVLRDDGWLLGVSIEQLPQGQEVIGFHLHRTVGEIEDICKMTVNGQTRLWWIAKRTIDGSTQRHVERLDQLELEPERATGHQLDAYVEWDGGAAKTITDISTDPVTDRVTVTAADHGFSNGDMVEYAGVGGMTVGGMTWLNSQTLVVADQTDDTFVLKTLSGSYVIGSLLDPWTSGGTVRQVTRSVTGLSHLEDEEVYAVADGAVLGPLTVAGGAVSLGRYANHVFAGLLIDGWLQPLRLVLPTAMGSTRGRQMRISRVWISVYRSWELELGRDESHLSKVLFWQMDTEINAAPELVTGDFDVTFDGGYSSDPTVLIHRHLPLPLCVRALATDVGIYGEKAGKT
jgi:hypothetical protein